MGRNVIDFMEGYVIGSEGANLQPLTVNENGIYLSKDYGCSGFSQVDVDVPTDTRIKKLDEAPSMWQESIADGWNIRVKIVSDIDNARDITFYEKPYQNEIMNYSIRVMVYFCVYLNNSIRYAVGKNTGIALYQEFYWASPNILNSIYQISTFYKMTGEITYDNTARPLINVRVDYEQTTESYDLNGVVDGTEIFYRTFSTGCSEFYGYPDSNCTYIINGSLDSFNSAVQGLHSACLKQIQ